MILRRLTTVVASTALAAGALGATAPAASADQGRRTALAGGATTLALDPGFAAALTSLGVSATPVGVASAGTTGIAFPVTTGRVDDDLEGKVRHVGGLRLAAGGVAVTATDFVVDTRRGVLTALVGGERIALLDLSLAGASVSTAGNGVTVSGVAADLTSGAAAALNAAFGVTALSDATKVGTATVATFVTRSA